MNRRELFIAAVAVPTAAIFPGKEKSVFPKNPAVGDMKSFIYNGTVWTSWTIAEIADAVWNVPVSKAYADIPSVL